jgi:hypothetical protein
MTLCPNLTSGDYPLSKSLVCRSHQRLASLHSLGETSNEGGEGRVSASTGILTGGSWCWWARKVWGLEAWGVWPREMERTNLMEGKGVSSNWPKMGWESHHQMTLWRKTHRRVWGWVKIMAWKKKVGLSHLLDWRVGWPSGMVGI